MRAKLTALIALCATLASLAAAERRCGRTTAWARHAESELAALDPTPVFDDRRRELRRTTINDTPEAMLAAS